MKNDDLEKILGEQPFRKVPAEWRTEILCAAEAGAHELSRDGGTGASAEGPVRSTARFWSAPALWRFGLRPWLVLWRELFWPSPAAWGTLAAIWLILVTINFVDSEPQTPSVAQASTRQQKLSPQVLMALHEQLRFRDELLGNLDAALAKPQRPQPRSQSSQTNSTV